MKTTEVQDPPRETLEQELARLRAENESLKLELKPKVAAPVPVDQIGLSVEWNVQPEKDDVGHRKVTSVADFLPTEKEPTKGPKLRESFDRAGQVSVRITKGGKPWRGEQIPVARALEILEQFAPLPGDDR